MIVKYNCKHENGHFIDNLPWGLFKAEDANKLYRLLTPAVTWGKLDNGQRETLTREIQASSSYQ